MDPTANLREQRRLAAEIQKVWDDCNGDGTLTTGQMTHVSDLAQELAEHVQALDVWMSGGGLIPEPWMKCR